jgi:FdhE protein
MRESAADPSVRPWQLLLEAAEREAAEAGWARAVPAPGPGGNGRPLLDGVTIRLDGALLGQWCARLLATAAAAGGGAATLADTTGRLDALALLRAVLGADANAVRVLATSAGVDAEALAAVVPLLPVPLLRACGTAWRERVPPGWGRGHCPVCGGWPTLAEARGLERSRQLRCGACGGDWALAWLTCPYCANADHEQLQALVPETGGETRRVEACRRCGGYIKTFTALTARAAADVLRTDLASIELDVAALERGYQRPAAPASLPDVRVVVHERRAWGLLARR